MWWCGLIGGTDSGVEASNDKALPFYVAGQSYSLNPLISHSFGGINVTRVDF
jgi:hypothetical protein